MDAVSIGRRRRPDAISADEKLAVHHVGFIGLAMIRRLLRAF